MTFFRLHRRLAAWLAMLTLTMSALAPTLAHAWVVAVDKGQWIEVCSASGMVWLKADLADGTNVAGEHSTDPGAPMADMGNHCPWCSFHLSVADLPPADAVVNIVSTGGSFSTAWFDVDRHAQVQRGTWARAPPIAS